MKHPRKTSNTTVLFNKSEKDILILRLSNVVNFALDMNASEMIPGLNISRINPEIRQIIYNAQVIKIYLEKHAAKFNVDCNKIASDIYNIIMPFIKKEHNFYKDIKTLIAPYATQQEVNSQTKGFENV